MHHFTINLAHYEGKNHKPDSQEERITFLIKKLREYNQLPSREMQQIMPVLFEVQQKCKDYDIANNFPSMNYIIEIIKALEAEHFRPDVRNNMTDIKANVLPDITNEELPDS